MKYFYANGAIHPIEDGEVPQWAKAMGEDGDFRMLSDDENDAYARQQGIKDRGFDMGAARWAGNEQAFVENPATGQMEMIVNTPQGPMLTSQAAAAGISGTPLMKPKDESTLSQFKDFGGTLAKLGAMGAGAYGVGSLLGGGLAGAGAGLGDGITASIFDGVGSSGVLSNTVEAGMGQGLQAGNLPDLASLSDLTVQNVGSGGLAAGGNVGGMGLTTGSGTGLGSLAELASGGLGAGLTTGGLGLGGVTGGITGAAAGAAAAKSAMGDVASGVNSFLKDNPWATTAASIAGTLGAGAMGANAAGDAADAQVGATRDSIAEARRQYDTTRADNAPFLATGTAANARLKQLLGLDTGYTGNDSGSLIKKFTMADRDADPVYQSGLQFGLNEGTKGINQRAIATGSYDSGNTLKALTRYGNDYGSTKAGDSYNRFVNDQSNIYSRLTGTSGTGQAAVNTGAQAGAQATNSITNSIDAAGNARAAGIVGGANSWGNAATGIGNALNNYQANETLRKLLEGRR